MSASEPRPGTRVLGTGTKRIGTVDAVFVDYVLLRTPGILPVDLYVPRSELAVAEDGSLRVETDAETAYERWHRPLKRAPHD